MLDYLNEIEKNQVEAFVSNETMKLAVKKVLLAGIYNNGTLKQGQDPKATQNFALAGVIKAIANGEKVDYQSIGQDLTACATGIYLLETGFQQLEKLKKVVSEPKEKKNPAR